MLLTLLLHAGCARPVARAQLATVDDFTLLKQMQWLDRSAGGFDFGAGGRLGYIDDVRTELLRRHVDWPAPVVEAIRDGRVELEMTHGQVVTSIGWPREFPRLLWAYAPGTGRRHFASPEVLIARGRANRWSYGDGPPYLFVWFREGRVWNIIDNRAEP